MTRPVDNWVAENQRYLTAALDSLRLRLGKSEVVSDEATTKADEALLVAAEQMSAPPALHTLAEIFGLSEFEQDVLLLCAGYELDAGFGVICASHRDDATHSYPTFGLTLAALPNAHWDALLPTAALRHWRLIEVSGIGVSTLTSAALHIDERILHYLRGIQYLDSRLSGLVRSVQAHKHAAPSHIELAHALSRQWAESGALLPILELHGADSAGRENIAAELCRDLNRQLYALSSARIPASASELEALVRLWGRESILSGYALMLDCNAEQSLPEIAQEFVQRASFPLIVSSNHRVATNRESLAAEVRKPDSREQDAIWRDSMAGSKLNGELEEIVGQFNLNSAQIASVSTRLRLHGDETGRDAMWAACRAEARPHMTRLAQRIMTTAVWDDLVLPEEQWETLHQIKAQVRQRYKVYEKWGFARKDSRGLGISALFAGSSGTGKTLAAEVIANDLRLDLYRIDLSQVVSKYIGETEKNLSQIFDAAESGGAVLLFDECDALFGKRSEVKDSHDRYANIEVSYLLQRMEAYRGLAILTTNMRHAIDKAFLRRIRFVVNFPFPDVALRAEIWRRIFPSEVPLKKIDATKLARLNVTGGNIRNIALGAAFMAAETDEPVGMSDLLKSARIECAKIEKALSEAEVKGWV